MSLIVRCQTFVTAAVIAADAAGGTSGLRPADVRFFFQLFTNWVEHDLMRPGQDIEPTQIRRVLADLVKRGWATKRSGGHRPRYRLTETGVLGSVAELVDPPVAHRRRTFDESLFVVCFCSLYREQLANASGAQRRRIHHLLDPKRAVAKARRRIGDLLADLDSRCEAGRTMQEALDNAHGATEAERIRCVAALGSYQLERVRPLGELMHALPNDVRDVELSRGPGTRVDLVFDPMAQVLRSELAALDRVEAALKVPSTAPVEAV